MVCASRVCLCLPVAHTGGGGGGKERGRGQTGLRVSVDGRHGWLHGLQAEGLAVRAPEHLELHVELWGYGIADEALEEAHHLLPDGP